jgi:hypothetical protein
MDLLNSLYWRENFAKIDIFHTFCSWFLPPPLPHDTTPSSSWNIDGFNRWEAFCLPVSASVGTTERIVCFSLLVQAAFHESIISETLQSLCTQKETTKTKSWEVLNSRAIQRFERVGKHVNLQFCVPIATEVQKGRSRVQWSERLYNVYFCTK